jgi:hypothetical protein
MLLKSSLSKRLLGATVVAALVLPLALMLMGPRPVPGK